MPLVLVREPDNPLDRNAVLIYRADDGYMDVTGAAHFCPLIERGATFSAQVYWINRDRPDYLKVYIWLFQLSEPVLKKRPVRLGVPRYRK
jgi:hypothetical protein